MGLTRLANLNAKTCQIGKLKEVL